MYAFHWKNKLGHQQYYLWLTLMNDVSEWMNEIIRLLKITDPHVSPTGKRSSARHIFIICYKSRFKKCLSKWLSRNTKSSLSSMLSRKISPQVKKLIPIWIISCKTYLPLYSQKIIWRLTGTYFFIATYISKFNKFVVFYLVSYELPSRLWVQFGSVMLCLENITNLPSSQQTFATKRPDRIRVRRYQSLYNVPTISVSNKMKLLR